MARTIRVRRVAPKPEPVRKMFKDEAIATAIVMKCDGHSAEEISKVTGYSTTILRRMLVEVEYDIGLPDSHREYGYHKEVILANLQHWQDMNEAIRKVQRDFRKKVVNLALIE